MALFKKNKMNHHVTENTYQNHLDVMRANYHENIITSKSLSKPLWLRLNRKDALNIIYRDKDIVFRNGQVYYASIVQANELLFDASNKIDLPANFLYSTHPIAEKYPEFLTELSEEIFYYKGMPEDQVPEYLHELVRIITDERDRSAVDFTISMTNPENPDEEINDIDIHFCSLIVFRKDIPNQVLCGTHFPVLAVPELSPAVIILPKEYWTAPFYDINLGL